MHIIASKDSNSWGKKLKRYDVTYSRWFICRDNGDRNCAPSVGVLFFYYFLGFSSFVFGGGGWGDVGFRNVGMSYIVNNDCNVLQL